MRYQHSALPVTLKQRWLTYCCISCAICKSLRLFMAQVTLCFVSNLHCVWQNYWRHEQSESADWEMFKTGQTLHTERNSCYFNHLSLFLIVTVFCQPIRARVFLISGQSVGQLIWSANVFELFDLIVWCCGVDVCRKFIYALHAAPYCHWTVLL